MIRFLKKLFSEDKSEDSEERFRRREREVDVICNNIREKYPTTSRMQVEEIIDMTLSFVEREVNHEKN